MKMLSDSQKATLGGLTDRYTEALLQSPETLSYLAGRALDLDAVTGYRLGLVVDPDPMHERFRGRLAIPYITPTGVVQIRFRCLEDHEHEGHGKYEGPAGDPTHLYNVGALLDAGGVLGVAEGELDAIVASEAGIYCVGVPGVQSWKRHYYRLFEDFEKVYLLGDGDEAGRAFVSKLAPNIPNSIARPMPSGYDITSYAVEYGTEALLEYVS